MPALAYSAVAVNEARRARDRSHALREQATRIRAAARAVCVMVQTACGAHNVSGGSGLDMPLEGLRILLLDDDPSVLRAISLFLASAMPDTTGATSPRRM